MTTNEPPGASARWWTPFYDDLLATMLLERADPDEVAHAIRFLVARLALARGDRVLDQCCGIGSLALPLAAEGMVVVGVDQSAAYVARAQRDAAALGLDATFHAADAFGFVASPRVRAVFNWWTSFGYAPTDDENREMLARAFDSLEPGGCFALDTLNVPGILRDFQRDVVTRRSTPAGEIVLVRESRVDLARGVLHKCWTYFLPDGRRVEHPSAVRLTMPHTLVDLLASVGFVEIELSGGVSGEPLGLDALRCIALARRPP